MAVFTATATVGIVGGNLSTTNDYAAVQPINVAFPVSFTNGTGTNQGNTYAATAVALATASTTTFDLNGGGLTDAYGAAIALVKLKGLIVRNRSTTAGENLTLAGNFCSSSLGLTSHVIKPGSVVCFIDPTGFTVTNSSADTITIQNANATTVTYDLIFWGNSS